MSAVNNSYELTQFGTWESTSLVELLGDLLQLALLPGDRPVEYSDSDFLRLKLMNILFKSINWIFPALLVSCPDFSALGVELPLGDAVLLRHVAAPRLELDVDLGPAMTDL